MIIKFIKKCFTIRCLKRDGFLKIIFKIKLLYVYKVNQYLAQI